MKNFFDLKVQSVARNAAANQTDDKKRAAYPFYSWMPKPLGCLVLFLMFFPVTFSGGAYMNNMAEMAGGMGVHSEDIQLAYYAWHATWRHAYYVVMVMLLVALLLVKFTMPDEEKTIAYKWEWRKMPTVACLGMMMVSLSYILVCGKTLDWFSSPRIMWATVFLLLSSAGYLWVSGRSEGRTCGCRPCCSRC